MTNLEDNNFNSNILQKIKEEKIIPKPKWQFLLKNSIIWTLGILSLILGAISTSLIFYMLTGEESGFGPGGPRNFEALFVIVPFFWIICLAIFAISVFYYIKHTKKGYKYSPKIIILAIIVISLVLGGALSALGVDRLVDDVLGERAPMYNHVINPRLDYWSNPEDGRLTGVIVSEEKLVTYYLIDINGETWVTQVQDKNDSDKIKIGHPVRLIGEKVGDHSFDVKEVMLVGPGRGFFKRPMPPMIPGMPLPTMCNKNKPCDNKHEDFIKDKIRNNLETSTEVKDN